MQIDSLNHRSENNGLFGLLPMFLAYKQRTPESFPSEKDKRRKEQLATNKEIKKAEGAFEKFKKSVSKKITAYNKSLDEKYTVAKPYLERLSTDATNYNKLVKHIDKILVKYFE